ncbi:hypothetical protein RSal33209_1839 [Renibacterium salmoninarum ATCC 33209]|uniref:Uncharacterized protein n=1 Tax=Renibacterium salmoninarum (strain ATCC 33209 / DSM 20767 / JCM 11484 / NBRC 15589 / NCIMB 2235) TaxID=288705 RepID=A9WQW6_RENSM|nr:hypothetical protein RSal33209_1839 [Renibacterium salmoninarum ATCC 33209]
MVRRVKVWYGQLLATSHSMIELAGEVGGSHIFVTVTGLRSSLETR